MLVQAGRVSGDTSLLQQSRKVTKTKLSMTSLKSSRMTWTKRKHKIIGKDCLPIAPLRCDAIHPDIIRRAGLWLNGLSSEDPSTGSCAGSNGSPSTVLVQTCNSAGSFFDIRNSCTISASATHGDSRPVIWKPATPSPSGLLATHCPFATASWRSVSVQIAPQDSQT